MEVVSSTDKQVQKKRSTSGKKKIIHLKKICYFFMLFMWHSWISGRIPIWNGLIHFEIYWKRKWWKVLLLFLFHVRTEQGFGSCPRLYDFSSILYHFNCINENLSCPNFGCGKLPKRDFKCSVFQSSLVSSHGIISAKNNGIFFRKHPLVNNNEILRWWNNQKYINKWGLGVLFNTQ